VREFHPRLADAAAGSPEPARFPLTAQLVIARQYGYTSWARLRRSRSPASCSASPPVTASSTAPRQAAAPWSQRQPVPGGLAPPVCPHLFASLYRW